MKLTLPSLISFCLIVVIVSQFLHVQVKKQHIENLSAENKALKEQLGDIGLNIGRLNENQTDIRLFQREIIQAIKEIDDHTASQFASLVRDLSSGYPKSNQNHHQNHLEISLARMDFSIAETKRESSALLAKTLALKNIMTLVPSLIPTTGYVSSHFGTRIDPFKHEVKRHEGVDIAGPIGTPVYSPADGVVILATTNQSFGKMIEIQHKYGVVTRFGHMNEILALKGQKVKRGQTIGSIGNTGDRCHGAHLHYEVMQGSKNLDPAKFMIVKPPREEHFF